MDTTRCTPAFTRWARGLARAEGLASSSMLDRPAIAYYVGAQKGDPLAVLAFSRLGNPSLMQSLMTWEISGEFWTVICEAS